MGQQGGVHVQSNITPAIKRVTSHHAQQQGRKSRFGHPMMDRKTKGRQVLHAISEVDLKMDIQINFSPNRSIKFHNTANCLMVTKRERRWVKKARSWR